MLALTLRTVWPLVADGANAVSIGAGAVAAAKRFDALRDGDVALGSLPATVTHTGTLVVLAIAAAQHRASSWRRGRENEEGGGREIKPCTLAKIFFKLICRTDSHPSMQESE